MLATIHATDAEIASKLGISERTLQRRYGALLKSGRQEGRINLRAWQMTAAKKGNTAMLIWLGKQILSQQDAPPPKIDDDADILYETEWGRPEDTPLEKN